MKETISSFTGEYRFLSNFYLCPVELAGHSYPSVEHAYQAAKCARPEDALKILQAPTPGAAKKLGRKIKLRPDWETDKLAVMELLLRRKFSDPALFAQLQATGDATLIEGNWWGDTFWGECPVGSGFNHLGRLLMEIREENKNKEIHSGFFHFFS